MTKPTTPQTIEEVLDLVYDLGGSDYFHHDDNWEERRPEALAAIEQLVLGRVIGKDVEHQNDPTHRCSHLTGESVLCNCGMANQLVLQSKQREALRHVLTRQ